MEFANLEHWPKDGGGTPEEASLLCTEPDAVCGVPLLCSMLESFGIPFMTGCYASGKQANTAGVDFYVPASRLEEAKELLDAPPEDDPATF